MAPSTSLASPIDIFLPDGSAIHSNLTTKWPILPSTVPSAASTAYVVPSLDKSLISVGQLCDNGCQAYFDKHTAQIIRNGSVILHGTRDKHTKLWTIKLPSITATDTSHKFVNNTPSSKSITCYAINSRTTIAQRIAYYHTICFSPSLSTWCRAINAGYYSSFPELTSKLVLKHPPLSVAMHKGHLDQTRANLSSRPRHIIKNLMTRNKTKVNYVAH